MAGEKFRTSREAYDQIRWDSRFDPADFVIGYESHGEPMKEVPFPEFEPGGEIPWHRVWYFRRRRGEIVWDRRERVDALFGASGRSRPAAGARASGLSAPLFEPRPAWRFDDDAGAWTPDAIGTKGAPGDGARDALVVATYNVLFDLYDAEVAPAKRRTPAALTLLRETDADLVAIEEVTPDFLRALLAERWVQKGYFVSDGPPAATVEPYGQVLLSRLPFVALGEHRFGGRKRAIAGEVALLGAPLEVVVVHLKSSREPDGGTARARQVDALLAHARRRAGEGVDLIVVGDTNFGDGPEDAEAAVAFAGEGFVDAWEATRPGERGATFDPARNSLAAFVGAGGPALRLDRVLVRSPSGRLAPREAALFGEAPLEGGPGPLGSPLHASDHFGLRCVLAVGEEDGGPAHSLSRG